MTHEPLAGLGEALLGDAVRAAPDLLGPYAEDASGAKGAAPLAVVRPSSREQLSGLVKWARVRKTPLAPVSSKPPHHRGDTLLPRPGIIVDMSGFDKIITVNRRNRVALFEAGVGFQQLADEARAAGLRAMLPLLPRAGKSALAAYLEREPVIYPRYQWDLSDPLLCLEIVWGTGDIFRTGSAAGPGTLSQQWRAGEFQKSPMGPGQNDWGRLVQGAQGSIAIATWASAKCEIRSPLEELFVASSDSIGPLIRASYRMFHQKLTDVHFILDRRAFLKLLAPDAAKWSEAEKKTRPWNLVYSVSGLAELPEERMALFKKRCAKALKDHGLSAGDPPLGSGEELLKLLGGVSPEPYWKTRPQGGMREVFFQTTMDQVPGFLAAFAGMIKNAGLAAERVATYVQPQLGGRVCHLEFILDYDADDEQAARAVNRFADGAALPLIREGAFFSRPYGAWAGPAMEAAGKTFPLYQKIKSIFDPDGILSPGRLGLGGGDDHGQA
jgi:FAD/FMN-containing dehydrogenase